MRGSTRIQLARMEHGIPWQIQVEKERTTEEEGVAQPFPAGKQMVVVCVTAACNSLRSLVLIFVAKLYFMISCKIN